ncbi:AraC family transcriptional regulator [Paenibacillus glycanilyticus]|uniref:DNA-binding transcriptional regulator AraC n=1 Tax=Paenibacillus glycanilyticus TaxID=126569 RepID=A0ABQ6GFY7_9BACL|nr:AraC family transcriptional regulator [Paenibacillus glycanilyticus]GLX69874.1 DNA-binding transcriptional regulator AraC [Paenibacillus glycanilyticus]
MKTIEVFWSDYSKHDVPFHHHSGNGLDSYIIRFQVEGTCLAFVDGSMRDIGPGDLLLFQPGDKYDLRIGFGEEPNLSLDYYIISDGPGMKEWWEEKKRPPLTRIASDKRLKEIWHQIVLEKRRLDGGNPALLTSLVWSLLMLIDRAIEEVPENQSQLAYHALLMRTYIEEHVTEPLTLQQVAQHTGLSVSRAVHLFKAHFGVSIIGYAQQLRLGRAINLLNHSALSLEQIAAETGLGSYAYFHRLFRERYGMSPGAYRKKR